jgi:hypothetical protein
MKTRIVVMLVTFTLLFGGTAWAADIFTSPLNTGDAADVSCRVLNTGTTTEQDVTIDIRDTFNISQTSFTLDIGAGRTEAVTDLTPAPVVYCRVSGISKTRARVTLCLRDVNLTPIQCVTSP